MAPIILPGLPTTRFIRVRSGRHAIGARLAQPAGISGIIPARVFGTRSNVVVNSDAEQVIVAERTGTTISYRAGSLENPVIREKLVAVLEGGKEAFSRRGQKYRLG